MEPVILGRGELTVCAKFSRFHVFLVLLHDLSNLHKDVYRGMSHFVRIRKMTKEDLAQTTSDITENLMNISRMMAQQVQQSEETITSLGK